MVRKIVWSLKAARQVKEAADYVAKDSLGYARALRDAALITASSLGKFASRGRLVPEAADLGFREIYVAGYRMLYFIDKKTVVIAGFLHGARDIGTYIGGDKARSKGKAKRSKIWH